jgi:hypothetical protein
MPSHPNVRATRQLDEGLLETDDLGRLIRWLTDSKDPELLAHDI